MVLIIIVCMAVHYFYAFRGVYRPYNQNIQAIRLVLQSPSPVLMLPIYSSYYNYYSMGETRQNNKEFCKFW